MVPVPPSRCAVFADITAGRAPPPDTYFTAPSDFVSWWDPTLRPGGAITLQMAPGQVQASLDRLRAHLVALEVRHSTLSLVDFAARDYEAGNTTNAGGGFTFKIEARPDVSTSVGARPRGRHRRCYTGKIKILVISEW